MVCPTRQKPGSNRRRVRPYLPRIAAVLAVAAASLVATGNPSSAATGSFTGTLTTPTAVTAGTPFTVTQTATNLTDTQLYPIIVGIRRLGFAVLSATKPRTGICRVAGSAACDGLALAPGETQTYTLVLKAYTTGTFQLQGWASSPTSIPGGSLTTTTITVS